MSSALETFLKRNRELCEASTPGPWELTKYTILAETHGKLGIVGWTANNKKTRTAMAANNAALMAASRTSLPLALEMLEDCVRVLKEVSDMGEYRATHCLAAIEEKAKENER